MNGSLLSIRGEACVSVVSEAARATAVRRIGVAVEFKQHVSVAAGKAVCESVGKADGGAVGAAV